MTVIKRGPYWHYDFFYKGRRYTGTTDQTVREQAQRVESQVKERLRLDTWNLAPADRMQTPSFTAWAEQYLAAQKTRIRRPDITLRTLRLVLAFWGARPTKSLPVKDGPYHNLRLLDPIADPTWIVRFEQWMADRNLSGSTKNSYRSALSGLYKLAAKPEWRLKTRTQERNPFQNIHRDRQRKRSVRLSPEQLRAWLSHAEAHVRLAIAIGSLAPKLRLHQVLKLRFDQHLDPELTEIRFREYKTMDRYDEEQVTAVSDDLRFILATVKKSRGPRALPFVVQYRGKPVKAITRGLKSAAKEAGLAYGLKHNGITFHALRHAMSTEIARLGNVARVLHAGTMGHKDPRTTEQFYTHLETDDQRPVLARLAERIDITTLLVDAGGNLVGSRRKMRGKDRKKRRIPETTKRRHNGEDRAAS